VSELRPRVLVAIGRDAEAALADLGMAAERVRHPSYGGQTEFVARMGELYGLPAKAPHAVQLTLP